MPEIKRTDDTDMDQVDSGLGEGSLETWKRRIMSDRDWAVGFYAQRNRDFETLADWYHKKHYGDLDLNTLRLDGEAPSDQENEHLSVINLPTDIIDMAVTMIINESPNIEVLSHKESKTAVDKQNKVERLLVGAYYINTIVQGVDPIYDATLNQLLYGWGVLRALWDIDREKMLDKKDGFVADYMFPILVQSISPYYVYPVPGGKFERWRAVVFLADRQKAEIEDEWGIKIEPQAAGDDEPIQEFYDDTLLEYVDYWCWHDDKIYNAVLADGEFVKEPQEMEEYEGLPYEVFFAREGPDKTAGEHVGLSFLYTVLEPIKEMELLANRELRSIELYADPPIVTKKNQDSPSIDVQTGPGARIEIETGEDVFYLQWQGNSPDVRAAKDFWSKLAQQFSFPDIFSGVVGGTSGLDTIALQQGGMAKIFTPRRNLEQALERLNTKIIRMFQKRRPKDTLRVRGTRMEADEEHTFAFDIKGNDTKGFEYTKVTIRAKFPQEELRNAAIAQGLVTSQIYSKRDTMSKFLFVQDPERMRRRIQEETAEDNPMWAEFHIKQLLAAPPQSPVSQALTPTEGEVGEGGVVGPEPTDQLPPPPDGAGPLGPEAEALNTIAGAGAVRPQTTDNPLNAIMSQAQTL